MYIARPSFYEDLRIIFATIMVLFEKESTEGVTEEQKAAVERVKEESAGKRRMEGQI